MPSKKPIEKKKEKDDLFEIKDRAFKIIKKRFKKFSIMIETDSYYVVAHPHEVKTLKRTPTIFSVYEQEESKCYCILKLVEFQDVPISKDIEDLLNLGCGHDYIDKRGNYIENIS